MKKWFGEATLAAALLCGPISVLAQETPQIVKDNLPKKAVCFVCAQSGE